jgi:hypothetical protein
LNKGTIISEVKGEEYKAEDIYKDVLKFSDKIYQSLPNKENYMYRYEILFEILAGYVKVQRIDKVKKLNDDL